MKKILILILTLLLVSCSDSEKSDKLNVVTTTTMLYDLVDVIGGDVVTNNGLCNPGVDPHLYKATASDVDKMNNADVIIYNGFHLEGELGEVFASLSSQNKQVISLEDAIEIENVLIDDEGNYDPHIWFNVSLWKEASKHIADQLSIIDPDNEIIYQQNLLNYLIELDNLNQYIEGRVNEITQEQRVLVTAHDAFNYFGNEYGFEVMAIQGINTQSQASTLDINELATYIANNKVKAIFLESSVPSKNIEAVQEAVNSKGFSVEIGGELYSDSLGDSASNHETYIKTFKANIDTIIDGLKATR